MPTVRSRMPSPLKYHGGKSYLAADLVGMMPPHITYVEPFAGGLSVLLAKDPEGVSEIVNDIDGDLVNLWWVLRDPEQFLTFVRILEATPFCEHFWQEASRPAGSDVERAVAYFVRCRQSLAGRMRNFAPRSRARTRRGMNEQVSAWLSAVEGLAEVHTRLKRLVILNKDAVAVVRDEDSPDTLFYLDPPYLAETRTAAAVYKHEMTAEQHRELLAAACECEGKVMLSGYASPMYERALRGWKRREFRLPNQAAGGKTKWTMTEVVWSNF